MTTFKQGDMWTKFGKVDLFCITVCGTFKANGSLVMGTGIAKELRDKIPNACKEAAYQLKAHYELHPYTLPSFHLGFSDQSIGLFQVKYHYSDPASLGLIKRSTVQLFRYIVNYPKMTVCLNFPGIGNGRLNRSEVLPIVNLLPDSVEVWEYDQT